MNTKFTPPASARRKSREEYLQHPKFMEMFGEAMMGVETPKDKIPEWMTSKLYEVLSDMSFPSLNVPFHIYEELVNGKCEEMPFGILQKAADIIFSSKPDRGASVHIEIVRAMAALLDTMQQITNPIRDKVIDKLINSEKIIK